MADDHTNVPQGPAASADAVNAAPIMLNAAGAETVTVPHGPMLLNANFARSGSDLQLTGQSGEQVVLGLLVYQFTQSTAWVGVMLAVYFLPFFVFGIAAQSGHAEFTHSVHRWGLDVYFVAFAFVVHVGMKCFVSVAFGQGNKVFDAIHNRRELGV